MLFATITEFGINPDETFNVLDELHAHAKAQAKSFPYEHYLIKTFGKTDLIEVTLFNHYFRFAEATASTGQAFRRSVGVRCPEEQDLPADHRENIRTVVEVLHGQKEAFQPFLAVIFIGLSPIPGLCIPPGERLVAYRAIEAFCDKGNGFWKRYGDVAKASGVPEDKPDPLIAPLIGLDSVELVLLVRAARLEQLSALTWAIRGQTLQDIESAEEWTDDEREQALDHAQMLLDPEMEMLRQKLEEHWRSCPLYRGNATVVGMRLREPDIRHDKWHLEELPTGREKDVAAAGATFLVHTRYIPGAKQPLKPLTWDDRDPVPDDGLPPPNLDVDSPADAPVDGKDRSFLLLFDRSDVLWTVNHPDQVKLERHLVHSHTVEMIRKFLSDVSGLESRPRPPGIWTAEEIAVRTTIPSGLEEDPGSELIDRFQMRLRELKNIHLDRQHPKSWTRRWLVATKGAGIAYSTTNVMVNVISTVLGRLTTDLDVFADLLPALKRLIEAAENKELAPTDLIWLTEVVERVAGSRARRDQALEVPRDTLAFESYAGYRLPREAFISLVESLAEAIERKSAFVLVRDRPAHRVACQIGPSNWDVLGVSAVTLHDPVHWLIAHELAYGLLAHTTTGELDTKVSAALGRMTSGVEGLRVRADESLDQILRRTAKRLRSQHRKSLAEPFAEALGRCLGELIADLCLWQSLALPGEDRSPERLRRRYWFVHGPGLVMALQSEYGSRPLDNPTLQAVILRCVFFSHLTERPGGSDPSWSSFLSATLAELDRLAPEMRLAGPSHRWDTSPPPDVAGWGEKPPSDETRRVLTRLQCLKEDLRVSDKRWRIAIRQLLDSLRFVERKTWELGELIGRWLAFVEALSEHHRLVSREKQKVWGLYGEYLAELVELWKDTADPWPPFVMGYRINDPSLETFRRRASIYGVALSRRGSVLVARSHGDREGQRQYQRRTFQLFSELAEHARGDRLRKLIDYLRTANQT